jgi:hypothetical protein
MTANYGQYGNGIFRVAGVFHGLKEMRENYFANQFNIQEFA